MSEVPGSRPAFPRRSALTLGAAAIAGLAAACGRSSTTSSAPSSAPTTPPSDTRSVATEAYVFGYPLVLMDATRAAGAPANRFFHASTLPTAADRQVVRMNRDTLYSQAWLDLKPEPLVLQVPDMGERYWLMPLLDMWTNVRQDPSSVRPGSDGSPPSPPFTYAITGPSWSGNLPDTVTRLAMPTSTAWLLGRIQVDGEADIPAVTAIQQQLRLVPLSRWANGAGIGDSSGAPADPAADPAAQVAAMDGPAFFSRLCALLADYPTTLDDAPTMQRFATIGITPGGDASKLPTDVLNAAVAEGRARIPAYTDPGWKNENGWEFSTGVGTYGTEYLTRASVAWQGLGANLAKDALYPTVFVTASDRVPRYRLRFPAGQLPPQDAFWSISAYGADNFLVPNEFGIYSIGHETPVVAGPDGSVDLVFQSDDPGSAVPRANWLPIPPSGGFSLSMRLYAPKDQALDGHWQPPRLTPTP
ncbi:DUF1254 domain-containing protein [Nocardia jejuensis]|uniref:DUF1254 domain-containing protein n=1 Tax=Nocardia jejuensis TaxID=328049 RepID=UPI0008346D85|nr:DUF1254 domain-containing protein [Nocardia jejuensis]